VTNASAKHEIAMQIITAKLPRMVRFSMPSIISDAMQGWMEVVGSVGAPADGDGDECRDGEWGGKKIIKAQLFSRQNVSIPPVILLIPAVPLLSRQLIY